MPLSELSQGRDDPYMGEWFHRLKRNGRAHEVIRIPGVAGIEPINMDSSKMVLWGSTISLLLTIPLWFAYLFSVSILCTKSILLASLVIIFIGSYLVSWIGYIRHELWHNYFPGVNNGFLFNIVSYLLLSDPKVYGQAHVTHHRDLHTVKDIEFCCEDYETNRRKRKLHFILEFLFGNIAWEIATTWRLIKRKQISIKREIFSASLRIAMILGLCFAANWIYPGSGKALVLVYFSTIWIGAVITRHDQWIEHLGILSDAPLQDRIRMVRNLPDSHWSNKLWNVLNHNDPRGHYFHHAYPQLNFREIEVMKLPEDVARTTIPQYLRFLWQYYKSI